MTLILTITLRREVVLPPRDARDLLLIVEALREPVAHFDQSS